MIHIPQSSFTKGTWRNGRGVSWDIASDQPFGAHSFGWRFAVAEIAASGPFSHYKNTDRLFTLIAGDGVDLAFEGGKTLAVHQGFVPHHFACDIATICTLRDGTAKALNLFTARYAYQAIATVVDVNGLMKVPEGNSLLFVLQGEIECGGLKLEQGDAAQIKADEPCVVKGRGAKLYHATLNALKHSLNPSLNH
jgi:environmental stress-induced protein Ves